MQVALLYAIEMKSLKLTTEVKRDALVELHQRGVILCFNKEDKVSSVVEVFF